MAPPALTNLYTTPNDIFDYMGIEGVEFRLDDRNEASGLTIQARAAAAQGATNLDVTALEKPLLAGSVLQFVSGGLTEAVEVRLTAVGRVGDTSITVAALSDAIPALAKATDFGVDLVMASRLVRAATYGTSQVKLYCCGRYNDSDLKNCWSANRWATVLGGQWIGRRCCRTEPKGVEKDAKLALEEMRQVRVGMLSLEDIGTRTAGWPFISNVTVDIRYNTAKVRVEQSISELTPTQFTQFVDWNSIFQFEAF